VPGQKKEKEIILKHLPTERVVELAKNLIRIPSPIENETEVARFLEKYMKDHGLETELVEVEPGRYQPIGRVKGTGGGYSLIFNGHIDTDVLLLEIKNPFLPRIEGNRLYGHGIFNMKSGVAAMVEAAVALQRAGLKLKGDLIVTPVVGELQGGVGTVTNIRRGVRADFGLVPEPYGEFLCLTHAGVEELAITLRGCSVHIRSMEQGINLSAKMVKVVDALNSMKFDFTLDPRFPGLPRMIVGSVICAHGVTYDLRGANFLPDLCTIVIDARYLPGMSLPSQKIKKVLEEMRREDSELQYEMQIPSDDPKAPAIPWCNRLNMPPQDLSPDEFIVRVHARNYEFLTGQKAPVGAIPVDHPFHSLSYAGDDDAHLTKAGIPSFCCGPNGKREPGGEQYTEIDSMVRVARNFALTAYDICTTSKV
jgi:acetylornithine deacetylase